MNDERRITSEPHLGSKRALKRVCTSAHVLVATNVFFILACTSLLADLPAIAQVEAPPALQLTAEERAWLDGNPDKLVLWFDSAFPPIEFASPSGEFTGLGADVAAMVERQLGVTFQMRVSYDWNKHLAALRTGECAIAPTIVRTPERETDVFFTRPYISTPVVIVTAQTFKDQLNVEDLDGQRVTVVSGYATEAYLRDEAGERVTIVPVPSVPQGLREVAFGEVDAMAVNLAVAAYYIEEEAIPNLRVAGKTEYTYDLCMGVSRKYPLLFSAIDKAVAALPREGLEAARDRWVSLDFSRGLDPELVRLIGLAAAFVLALLLSLAFITYFLKRRLNEEVSNLRAAQRQLMDQSERLSLATEASSAGVWDIYPAADRIRVNEQCYTMLDRPVSDLDRPLDDWMDLMHPNDLDATKGTFKAYVASGGEGVFEAEFRVQAADGSWRWVLGKGRAVAWDEGGVPSRIAGLTLDIHSRKRVEEELAASEQRFRAIFDHAPYAITINSPEDGRYLDANEAFLSSRGLSKNELTGTGVDHILSLSDETLAEVTRRLKEEGVLRDLEATVQARDGSVQHVLFSSVLVDIQGQKQILSMVVDVTERRRAQDALREREETFRALSENSEDVIMRFDRDLRHTYVNRSAERGTGIPAEEFIGKTHEELGFPAELTERWEKGLREVFDTGKTLRLEFQLPSGVWMDWLVMPEFGRSGKVEAVLTSARDITERKRAEEEQEELRQQLLQAQRMESIGRLAGGVAHDFNNMLAVILGQVELALGQEGTAEGLHSSLLEIQEAAQRSAELTRQLLAFARKQATAPQVLDVNRIVERLLNMLRRLLGEEIELEWAPGNDVCPVLIDPSQLDQILANLCVNARDAIGGVGRVKIETKTASFSGAHGKTRAGFMPGNYVLLSVSDDGCGMDEETREHLFEPFYTTKESGAGTGLGLATVYGIVKQNDGFINLQSEPGVGTTLEIYLPQSEGDPVDAPAPEPRGAQKGQGETVLIVEDEPAILEIGRRGLELMGYRVLTASTPGEALRLAGEHPGSIDLFVSDVVMPEMNGRDLAERIAKVRPGTATLFMSGYTADVIVHRGVLDDGVDFIQKPFTMAELASKVREVLDRG